MTLDREALTRRTIVLLGEDCTLRPASGAPAYTVRGIFDSHAATAAAVEGRPGVHAAAITFRAMDADLGAACEGDSLERGAERYAIAARPEPELGQVTLILELQGVHA